MGLLDDNAAALKQGFEDQISKIDAAKAELQQKEVLVDQMLSQAAQDVKDAHDQGYAEGKASVVLPDPNSPDKLFTQSDMDQLAATAKSEKAAELQPQIDQANADKAAALQQVSDLQAQLDAAKQAQADAEAKLAQDKQNDAAIADAVEQEIQKLK